MKIDTLNLNTQISPFLSMNASNVVGQGILVGKIIYKIGLIVFFL